MTSLEGWRSAIELRPRARREPLDGPPGWHRQRTGYGHPWVTASPAFRPWRGARSREPIRAPRDGRLRSVLTGCGAAWLARLLWEQEAPGSNPGIPTRSGFGAQPGQRARRLRRPSQARRRWLFPVRRDVTVSGAASAATSQAPACGRRRTEHQSAWPASAPRTNGRTRPGQ